MSAYEQHERRRMERYRRRTRRIVAAQDHYRHWALAETIRRYRELIRAWLS